MISPEVEAWFTRYDNPKRDVVLRVRHMVLGVDPRIREVIKWNTPTFVYRGNMASIYPLSLDHATLVFHQGQHLPGRFEHAAPDGDHARIIRVTSFEEAEERRDVIESLVGAWIAWREAHSG